MMWRDWSGFGVCPGLAGAPRLSVLAIFTRYFDLSRPAFAGSILALRDCRVRAMRYWLDHKARNHENILSVAARSFRERGGDSSGIGTEMKKTGPPRMFE